MVNRWMMEGWQLQPSWVPWGLHMSCGVFTFRRRSTGVSINVVVLPLTSVLIRAATKLAMAIFNAMLHFKIPLDLLWTKANNPVVGVLLSLLAIVFLCFMFLSNYLLIAKCQIDTNKLVAKLCAMKVARYHEIQTQLWNTEESPASYID